MQINGRTSKPQNDSSKKAGSIKERPANLDALIDKKLAEKKASLASANNAPVKKVSNAGKK